MNRILKNGIGILIATFIVLLLIAPANVSAATVKLSKCKITLSKTKYKYSGKARKPKVTVTYKNKILVKGTDYTVKYSNNKNPGTATVTIKGKGGYSGTVKKTFTILENGLRLENSGGLLFEGETYKIEPKGSIGTVKYSSKNSSVAEVDDQGEVRARSAGTTTITVSDTKKSVSLKVTVINPDYVPISLNLNAAEKQQAQVIRLDDNISYKWVSGDTEIATVDENGVIYGVPGKGGTTQVKISVKTLNGETTCGGINVTVTAKASTYEVDITGSTYNTASGNVTGYIKEGQSADLNLMENPLEGAYADGDAYWHNAGLSTVYLNNYNYYFVTDSWNNRILVYKVPSKVTWGEKNHSVTKYLYCVLGQDSITGIEAGPELNRLNWPHDAAATVVNNQIKVYVSDTNNNRILVWENLLNIEDSSSADYGKKFGLSASYSILQKFDNSKVNYSDACYKGTRIMNDQESGIHWPWAVWTDGTRLMATSTTDGCLLIWDELPTVSDKFPDRVIYTGGTIRTITCKGNYLILGDHNITTESGSVVAGARVIEDYTKLNGFVAKSGSKTLFRYSEPDFSEDEYYYVDLGSYPSGLYLKSALTLADGTKLKKGTLLLQVAGSILVFPNGKLSETSLKPSYYIGGGVFEETRIFRHTVGDYCSMLVDHSGNFYITEGARGNYVGYKKGTFPAEPADVTAEMMKQQDRPEAFVNGAYYETAQDGTYMKFSTDFPNLVIGSENCTDNEYQLTYRYQNCMVDSDGKHLVIGTDSAGMGSKLIIYKNIPNESTAVPDVVYSFSVQENVNDLKLYDDGKKTMVMVGGMNSIFIWNNIEETIKGNEPDQVLRKNFGSVEVNDIKSFDYDGEYFYVSDMNGIYIFKGIPKENQKPAATLNYQGGARINVCECNDGAIYVCISSVEEPAIYTRKDALKNGNKYLIRGAVTYATSGLKGNSLKGEKQYDKREGINVGCNDLFVTAEGCVIMTDGMYRVIIWDSIDEAVREGKTNKESASKIVLGQGKDNYDYYDVLLADPTSEYFAINIDPVSIESPTTLFRPYDIAYDGNYLWISDYKFSGGVKRFSGKLQNTD